MTGESFTKIGFLAFFTKICRFYSLINWDEYSILDPSELSVPQLEHNSGNEPYLISDCDNIHVENEQNLSPPPIHMYQNYPRPSHRRSLSLPSVSKTSWNPVLILIPMKLGRDQKINPIYGQCLKSFLATDTCVGVIGGKPKHSLYFVGFQDDNLIHLDPHLVQDKVDIFQEDFDLQSYHSKTPRKLALSKMDPSCCIGFLIETEHQFEGWCQMSSELATPSQRGHNYPMFTIVDGPNVPSVSEVLHDIDQLNSIDEAGLDATLMIPPSDCHENDEFVFL